MEAISSQMCAVAFQVFDRYGSVKAKYRSSGAKRNRQFSQDEKGDGGSQDLRYGSNEAFERSWTLHALLSQVLGATSDFEPRREEAGGLENEELSETAIFTEVEKIKLERLRDTLPLHHAALTLGDNELKAFLMTHVDNNIGWDRVTTSEATFLHLTACELKPPSTQWLLENVPNTDFLKTARDINGYTPPEALQEKLETTRTQEQVGSRVLNIRVYMRRVSGTVSIT
ncbi:predicted protein [Aspergillus nidulans FGSC A4]|uniref:Uncharacterized protein n=1 Tax=Emericella nidulans (strain FGSC A4 / ATCC 38163 / CBS 112.46 / NRRL 194 / M139) TaxID=227321 RepID=Q5AWC0_EMENI|nr:hypothetical protein [Aspergillus nidulans FGSC A4]EAA61781.1 predicted protein [Aspergillus nidulans FGSC A4]CBF78433.1 TPA: conserved hypothetical protein [Aspergillus nidulans FGSC A4]|eukprot:XP_680679.1 predicted protein [Aspergillus nidulans FGSC A4]